MYSVYVLYSPDFDKIYIGETSDLPTRLHYHNNGPRKGYTSRFRPWKVIHRELFDTRSEALRREKELKSARGRKWIREDLISQN